MLARRSAPVQPASDAGPVRLDSVPSIPLSSRGGRATKVRMRSVGARGSSGARDPSDPSLRSRSSACPAPQRRPEREEFALSVLSRCKGSPPVRRVVGPATLALLALAGATGAPLPSGLLAQDLPPGGARALPGALPLKVELPPPAPGPCEASELLALVERPVTDAARAGARSLMNEANQAALLGDDTRTRALLREAAELDPTNTEVAYRLGRLLEAAGEEGAALLEYCRVLLVDPDGPDGEEARERIQELAVVEEDPIPGIARVAFQQGVGAVQAQRYDDAVLHFSRALVELPGWPDGYYNRGIAHHGQGRVSAALGDFERYLELAPAAPDRDRVARHIAALAPSAPASGPNPGTVLLTGILFPGMGHFVSDRPGMGLLVLAGAGGAAAAAVFYTEVEVSCLVPAVDGVCPPGQVDRRTERRPLFYPGAAAAGAITILGAVHAWSGARGRRARASVGGDGALEFRLGATPEGGPRGQRAWAGALFVAPPAPSDPELRWSAGLRFRPR
jgi:tetratricopeptide (TPR) repeat protein